MQPPRRYETKLTIEALTKCQGSCSGCFMTQEERKRGWVWDSKRFDKAEAFAISYIESYDSYHKSLSERHRAIYDGREEREIALNFGHGNYLLINEDEIERILQFAKRINKTETMPFITISAVGNPEVVEKACDVWSGAMKRNRQKMNADVVFDPAKLSLRQYGKIYRHNLEKIRESFGGFDLHVNVGPETISQMSPGELVDFVSENKFNILSLNVLPTRESAERFAPKWPQITEWLKAVLLEWRGHSFFLNVTQPVSAILKMMHHDKEEIEDTGKDQWIIKTAEHQLRKSAYIDFAGNVFASIAGIGDVHCCSRNGFANIAHIDNGLEHGRVNTKPIAASLYSSIASKSSCLSCDEREICVLTGGGIYCNLMPAVDGDCRNGLRGLYAAIKDMFFEGVNFYCNTSAWKDDAQRNEIAT